MHRTRCQDRAASTPTKLYTFAPSASGDEVSSWNLMARASVWHHVVENRVLMGQSRWVHWPLINGS